MFNFFLKKRNKTKAKKIIPFFLASIVFTILLSNTSGFRKIELSFFDLALSTKNSIAEKRNWDIVIVDITDQADDEIPEVWPWPRTYYSHLIENLYKAGALAVGFDIEMNMERPEDSIFANKVKDYKNIVLAVKVIGNEGRIAKRLVEPSKNLVTNNTKYGHVNIDTEIDGVIRQYWSSINYRGKNYESIALSLYNSVYKKNEKFPSFWLDYYGKSRTFPYVSFELVIDDSTFETTMEKEFEEKINTFENDILPSNIFKNKIVLVGSSMENLHDIKLTPLDANTPGVEIHATALQSMIDKRFIFNPPMYLSLLLILITIIIISFVALYFSTGKSFFILLLYVLLSAGFSLFVFVKFLIFYNSVIIIAYSLLVYIGINIALFLIEKNDKQMITNMFSHYLPSSVVNDLINNPSSLKLGGEKREMTVLFSDVEAFTTISEQITPEELVALLNEYLTTMSDIVFDNGGIIDKYEGDAIMAEFGMPIKVKDHALRACKTALQMQKSLSDLRIKFISEGRPALKARIGLSSGDMIFGNMGSKQIFDYTVMGDTVNLGSRLEGVNKVYNTKIMINLRTYELIKDDCFAREMDLIRVKGKFKPVKIFELITLRTNEDQKEIKQVIESFEKGLSLYRKQKWEEAIICFNNVKKIWNNDAPSDIFIKRCNNFRNNPPGEEWDGVNILTEK